MSDELTPAELAAMPDDGKDVLGLLALEEALTDPDDEAGA